MSKKPLFYGVLILSIGILLPYSASADTLSRTPAQDRWLSAHKNTITVLPQKTLAPYVFAGSGTVRKIKGLSAEYIEAIAKKYGVSVSYTDPLSQAEILQQVKEGEEGVVLSLTPTEDLSQYFYFSDSYITMPAVIVTRKDYKEKKKAVTLSDFSGKRVAAGKTYAVIQYIQTNYPKVLIEPVYDDEVALQKLLLGEVDAAVMDLGALSYYTANDVLSYVKAVGRTGFEYKHSFAVPKSSPELLLLLENGLKEMSEAEKQVITEHWISQEIGTLSSQKDTSSQRDTGMDDTLLVVLVFAGFVIVIVATTITIITVRKTQFKIPFYKKREDATAKAQLAELEEVHNSLEQELEHIAALEKDIEEKLK